MSRIKTDLPEHLRTTMWLWDIRSMEYSDGKDRLSLLWIRFGNKENNVIEYSGSWDANA
jgi:hypothetical protein